MFLSYARFDLSTSKHFLDFAGQKINLRGYPDVQIQPHRDFLFVVLCYCARFFSRRPFKRDMMANVFGIILLASDFRHRFQDDSWLVSSDDPNRIQETQSITL